MKMTCKGIWNKQSICKTYEKNLMCIHELLSWLVIRYAFNEKYIFPDLDQFLSSTVYIRLKL
jgi:hypothetical protein